MRGGSSILGACWALAPMLGATTCAAAEPPHLELFAEVDQRVVGIGEPFRFQVQAYYAGDTCAPLDSALARAVPEYDAAVIELIRAEPAEQQEQERLNRTICTRTVRYVMRARQTGSLPTIAMQVQVGATPLRAAAAPMVAYRVETGYYRATRSVLSILADIHGANGEILTRTGSAFLVAPDAAVTSFHVVMDAFRVRVSLPDGRKLRTRRVWAVDPENDIAVLHLAPDRIAAAGLQPLELLPSEEKPAGETVVFTSGWPMGVQRSTAGVFFGEALMLPEGGEWISGNPLLPGDSGGPLLDANGRVRGVVSAGTLYRSNNMLHQDVCFATDPHLALARMHAAERPRRMRAAFRSRDVREAPRAHALRLASLLNLGSRNLPALGTSLSHVDAGARRRPDDARLHYQRGTILQMLGAYEQAEASFRTALEARADYFPAAYMLALHALLRRDLQSAEHYFLRIGRSSPYETLATYGLALTHMQRSRYSEAEALLREVVRLDPSFAPAVYDLGRCYLSRDQVSGAVVLAERLQTLDAGWAERLQQMIRYDVLRPVRLYQMPYAPLHTEYLKQMLFNEP